MREFAVELNKTAGYVSRIEVRDEIPSPELICEISAVLHCDVEELFSLAKESKLSKAEEQIEFRQSSALSLFRKTQEN